MNHDCILPGTIKDGQSITRDWQPVARELIHGVALREVRNVPKEGGTLTELYRADWQLDQVPVTQVFQSILYPGTISGWHVHTQTTDRLFVSLGMMRIVLFDARKNSPTFNKINEFKIGEWRPALVVVPPGVWHAVENYADQRALLMNIVDIAYDYESPDHLRLPIDTDQIPYRFKTTTQKDALAQK